MGTHPIFESDFDSNRMLSRILSRATVRVAPRRAGGMLTKPHGQTWLQIWAWTGAEGAELWLLTVYGCWAFGTLIYQTCYATTYKKTEITTLPYLNKDYNIISGRKLNGSPMFAPCSKKSMPSKSFFVFNINRRLTIKYRH